MKRQKISLCRSRPPKYAELSYFTLLFCRGRQRNVTVTKHSAHAQPLFSSLNFLFCGVLVAVDVVTLSMYVFIVLGMATVLTNKKYEIATLAN